MILFIIVGVGGWECVGKRESCAFLGDFVYTIEKNEEREGCLFLDL